MRTNRDYFTEVQPAAFIMGIVRVYFKAENEFLHTSYIYFRRIIRWAGHVARMGRGEVHLSL